MTDPVAIFFFFFSMKHVGSIPRLNSSFTEPVLLAIIGGSGLHQFDSLVPVAKLNIETPWGAPSCQLPSQERHPAFQSPFWPAMALITSTLPPTFPPEPTLLLSKDWGARNCFLFGCRISRKPSGLETFLCRTKSLTEPKDCARLPFRFRVCCPRRVWRAF